MREPVIVSFEVETGQTWIDPDGVGWYVKFIDADEVHLERTVVASAPVRDLVRTHRQPNDAPSAPTPLDEGERR